MQTNSHVMYHKTRALINSKKHTFPALGKLRREAAYEYIKGQPTGVPILRYDLYRAVGYDVTTRKEKNAAYQWLANMIRNNWLLVETIPQSKKIYVWNPHDVTVKVPSRVIDELPHAEQKEVRAIRRDWRDADLVADTLKTENRKKQDDTPAHESIQAMNERLIRERNERIEAGVATNTDVHLEQVRKLKKTSQQKLARQVEKERAAEAAKLVEMKQVANAAVVDELEQAFSEQTIELDVLRKSLEDKSAELNDLYKKTDEEVSALKAELESLRKRNAESDNVGKVMPSSEVVEAMARDYAWKQNSDSLRGFIESLKEWHGL